MDFEEILDRIREEIERDDGIREQVLPLARNAVRKCSESVKLSHRGEFDLARSHLEEAKTIIDEVKSLLSGSEYLAMSRIIDTAHQELAEAAALVSLLEGKEIPSPSTLSIPSRPYLTGLGDTIGELRRAILNDLRKDNIERAERLLASMERIFEGLVSFDYPNALIPDLRRKCDIARNLIERTRGDVTTAVRQKRMIEELKQFERRMRLES